MTKKLVDFSQQSANANRHTERGMRLLEKSIQEDGWIGAITAAADGEIFDGSARHEVGTATGFDDAIVVESDGRRPVIIRRTDIPSAADPRAIALGIKANRVASLNLEWEPGALATIAALPDVDLTPYFTDIEWADVAQQEREAVDANELWKGMPDFEQEDQLGWKTIRVHFENEQDYEAFARLVNQTLTKQTKYIWYPYQAPLDALSHRVEDES